MGIKKTPSCSSCKNCTIIICHFLSRIMQDHEREKSFDFQVIGSLHFCYRQFCSLKCMRWGEKRDWSKEHFRDKGQLGRGNFLLPLIKIFRLHMLWIIFLKRKKLKGKRVIFCFKKYLPFPLCRVVSIVENEVKKRSLSPMAIRATINCL